MRSCRTEPTDFAGHRVSQVTYTYRGVDPIPVMPPEEQTRISQPKEATMPFELQSDGCCTIDQRPGSSVIDKQRRRLAVQRCLHQDDAANELEAERLPICDG